MNRPDGYWDKVGKAVEERRNLSVQKGVAIKVGWIHQTKRMASLSRGRYASRVRADGKILCLKCRKYRDPKWFWVTGAGTFLNNCKTCSHPRSRKT